MTYTLNEVHSLPRTLAQTRAEIFGIALYALPGIGYPFIVYFAGWHAAAYLAIPVATLAPFYAVACLRPIVRESRWLVGLLSNQFESFHPLYRRFPDYDFVAAIALAKGIQSDGNFDFSFHVNRNERLPRLHGAILVKNSSCTHSSGDIHPLEPLELLALARSITGNLNPYALGIDSNSFSVDLTALSAHEKLSLVQSYRETMAELRSKTAPLSIWPWRCSKPSE